MNENSEIIKAAYDAFHKGNIPAVVKLLSPNVNWTIAGPKEVIPFAGLHFGHDDVGKLFKARAKLESVRKFEPHQHFADDDTVMVLGHYHAHVTATDREYDSDWVHVFKLKDGKITHFREFYDTAAAVRAYTKEPVPEGTIQTESGIS